MAKKYATCKYNIKTGKYKLNLFFQLVYLRFLCNRKLRLTNLR